MRRGQGQQHEERAIAVGLGEGLGLFEEVAGEPGEVDLALVFGQAARVRLVELQRPHVVAVGQSVETVEALHRGRPVRRYMPQVPLADQRGRIVGLQRLGDRPGVGRQAGGVRRLDDLVRQPRADRIAPGEKPGPRRRADVGRSVEVREARALLRHAVEVGGPDVGRAVAAEIAVAEIVGQDHDDVRRSHASPSLFRRRRGLARFSRAASRRRRDRPRGRPPGLPGRALPAPRR